MRVLGIVFCGPPGNTFEAEGRLVSIATALATRCAIDWVLAAGSRRATVDLEHRWAPPGGGRICTLEPAESIQPGWWREMRARHLEHHEGPRQALQVDAALGRLDPTVGRHQMAKILGEGQYDFVWCANVVAMALYGKVRRDLPVVVDLKAPIGGGSRVAAPVPDPAEWHRFEQHVAASAHIVTLPSPDARETLGVPGALVIDPSAAVDVARMHDAFAEMCRWNDAFHGLSR